MERRRGEDNERWIRREEEKKKKRRGKEEEKRKHIKRSPFVCGYLHSVMLTLPFAITYFSYREKKKRRETLKDEGRVKKGERKSVNDASFGGVIG